MMQIRTNAYALTPAVKSCIVCNNLVKPLNVSMHHMFHVTVKDFVTSFSSNMQCRKAISWYMILFSLQHHTVRCSKLKYIFLLNDATKTVSIEIKEYIVKNITYFFPESRNASNSAAILQQRAWRLCDEEHSVTLRWPSGRKDHKNVILGFSLRQTEKVYMTLELKSDMIVKQFLLYVVKMKIKWEYFYFYFFCNINFKLKVFWSFSILSWVVCS